MSRSDRSERPPWLGEDARGWDHARFHLCLLIDHRVTADHLGVYCSLAAHAEVRNGEAYPGAETIAGYLGISERHVRDCLKDLESWRYIRVEPRRGKSSIVRLLRPPTLDEWIRDTNPHSVDDAEKVSAAATTGADTSERDEPPLPKTTETSPHIEEARRLCDLLAELMVKNGCRTPKITKAWVSDMDRILRIDERPAESVERAIRWAQGDSFWRANIMSPAKLRDKYDQLRLAAKKSTPANAPSQRISSGRPATADLDLDV